MKSILTVVSMLVLVSVTICAARAQEWNFQVVDDAGDMGYQSQIAVTSGGIPYILYKNGSQNKLTLAYWDPAGGEDGTWEILEVDSYTNVYSSIEIAADQYDHMHIVWSTYSSPTGIHYGVFDATTKSWIISDELIIGQTGNPDLTLFDDAGTIVPSVTYIASFTLYAATRDPGSGLWEIETVYDSHYVDKFPSIAVDSGGFLHISYYESNGYNLMYATNATPDTAWVSEYVDIDGTVGEYSSIVVDQDDVPYIIYYDKTNTDLKYAKLLAE